MGTGRHPPRGLPRGSLSPQPGDNRAPHRPQAGVHNGSRRSSVSTSSQGWRRLHRTGASTHCSREAEGHYIQHPGLLTSPNPLYARDMAQKGAQRHAWAELAGWQAGSRGLLQLDPYAAALCEGPAHVQSHPPQDQKPKARSRCLLERSALLAASPALSGTGPQGRVQVAPWDTQVLFRVQPRTEGPASEAAAGTALRAGDRGRRAGRWSWAVARGRGCCPARPRAPSHVWLSGTLHCTASRLLSLEASPLPSQHSRPSRSPGDRLASPPRSSALSTGSLLSVFLFFGKKRWAFFP